MNGKNLIVGLVAALLLLPALPYVMAAGTISIETGSKFYKPGELVTISGVTSAGIGKDVYITVNSTQANAFTRTVESVADGKFQASFTLVDSAYIGVYNVRANDGTNKVNSHFVVTNITPADLADNLIKLAEDAQTRVETRFKQLEDQGLTISTEAQKAYDAGVLSLKDAKISLSGGKSAEALASARDAMVNFRDALRDAIKSAKLDEVEDSKDVVLASTIQRGLNLVEKFDKTIIRLEDDGQTGLSATKTALIDAKDDLTNAKTKLLDKDLTGAQTLVDAAKIKLETVLTNLRVIAETRAHDGILKWLNGAEQRINNLEAQLKNMMNGKNKDAAQAALGKLGEARGKLDKAKNGLALGKDLEALGNIGQAENDVKKGIGNVGSSESSSKLGNANMIQAQIQFLQRTEAQMQKWGMDITAIKAQIASLQTQLDAQSITP